MIASVLHPHRLIKSRRARDTHDILSSIGIALIVLSIDQDERLSISSSHLQWRSVSVRRWRQAGTRIHSLGQSKRMRAKEEYAAVVARKTICRRRTERERFAGKLTASRMPAADLRYLKSQYENQHCAPALLVSIPAVNSGSSERSELPSIMPTNFSRASVKMLASNLLTASGIYIN